MEKDQEKVKKHESKKKSKEEYKTPNGLAPEFQLSPGDDPDKIFAREVELIAEVRAKCDRVAEWPDRFILIFLFARKHDVERTVDFLNEHIDFVLNDLQGEPVTKTNLQPIAFSRLDLELITTSDAIWRPGLYDLADRILIYRRMNCYFPKEIDHVEKLASMCFWWYDLFQCVPLKYHRNGISSVIDMSGMSNRNWDFSSESNKRQQQQLSMFPGRMRAGWVINSNFLFKAVVAAGRVIWKDKVMERIKTVHKADLINLIPAENLPVELGGSWVPDVKKDWAEDYVARFRPKGPANAWV